MTIASRLAGSMRRVLRRAGYAVVPANRLAYLDEQATIAEKAANLGMLAEGELGRALGLLDESLSQLNQDYFVLHETGWKRDGYFVEFGATDGRSFNNTWLLEKAFGWSGILAEPARVWRDALQNSGRVARLEFDCVWSKTGETLTFSEASWGELSTLESFRAADGHRRRRSGTYPVQTISLNDMLARHRAPREMDYLSIDTEGSEYEILKALDFDRYRFGCITCEHNFTDNREAVHALLTSHGYRRVFTEFSQFDDWYVNTDK